MKKLMKQTSKMFVLGMSLVVSMSAYPKEMTINKPAVISVKDDAPLSQLSDDQIQEICNQKCLESIKKYFNLTESNLPKNIVFHTAVLDEPHLNKEEAKWIAEVESDYKQKKYSEAQYKKEIDNIKKEYIKCRNNVAKLGYTQVDCLYCEDIEKPNTYYTISFNGETGEILSIRIPISDKAWKLMKEKKYNQANVSETTINEGILSFVKKHHIGNIDNPTIVHGGGKRPSAYIQDANDPNKCAIIFIDVESYKVRGFDVREVVRETLQELKKK